MRRPVPLSLAVFLLFPAALLMAQGGGSGDTNGNQVPPSGTVSKDGSSNSDLDKSGTTNTIPNQDGSSERDNQFRSDEANTKKYSGAVNDAKDKKFKPKDGTESSYKPYDQTSHDLNHNHGGLSVDTAPLPPGAKTKDYLQHIVGGASASAFGAAGSLGTN